MPLTIASIWPISLKAYRPGYLPVNTWELAPVRRGDKPSTVEVGDCFQITREPVTYRQKRETIQAMELAPDLVNEWTNMAWCTEDERPGIWVCAGPSPTTDEIAIYARKQHNLMAKLVETGDTKFADQNDRGRTIVPLMKLAAQYLGLERPWLHELRDAETKRCVWCTEFIPGAAVICPKCSNVVDAARYKAMQDQMSEVLQPKAAGPTPVPQTTPFQPKHGARA